MEFFCSGLFLLILIVAFWLRTPAGRRYFTGLQRQWRAEQRQRGRKGGGRRG